jgi:chloride channel 3/4/5
VSYFFPPKVMWRSFWCAAVAAMTLKFLNPFGNGSIVLFAVTYTKEYHYWEFPIFLLLGIFGVSRLFGWADNRACMELSFPA